MNENKSSVKRLLLLQAQSLRSQADGIEALASTLPDDGDAGAQHLDLDVLQTEFGLGREAVKAAVARGELKAFTGARRKILVARAEVERWIASRPYTPGPRRIAPADMNAWDAQVEAELKRMSGGGG